MALIPNNGWETGDAGGWTFVNGSLGGSVTVVTASARSGLYGLKIVKNSAGSQSYTYYDFPGFASLVGYTVELQVWDRFDSGQWGDIRIDDGVGNTIEPMSGAASTWLSTTVSRVIQAGATRLRFLVTGTSAGVNATISVDDMCVTVKDAGGNIVWSCNLVAEPGAPGGQGSSYSVEVDWDKDGVWTESGSAISSDVKNMSWERGIDSELDHVATGILTLRVRNDTGKYSPENAASVLSPNVLPGRPIRVRAIYDGTIYDLFKGFIEKIVPHPAPDNQTCDILCTDGMDKLNRSTIEAPKRGVVTSLKMGQATAVSGVNITFANANPDTITRASGSFVTDGFQAGMALRVEGSTSNDTGEGVNPTYYVIATVTALVLTLHADEGLIAEGPVAGVTLTAYGPMGIILDEAGWPFADRSLDAGADTLDVWFAHREKALAATQKLLDGEKSLAYINGAGKFVYEDRHHRLKTGLGGAADHITSQATFSDTMVDMEYEFSARTVRNIAVVTGHKRTAESTTPRLWGTRDRPKIETGQVLTLWAHLNDPAPTINVPATDGTDFGISDTSTGADDAALRANVPVIFTKYGQSVKMQFTNNNTKPVYIVPGSTDANYALYIDGKEYDDDEIFALEQDATSKTAYGDRAIDLDNPFVGNFNTLRSYAEWLVSRYKDPQPDAVRMKVINSSSALLTQQLAREISDRITVTATELGINAKGYFINKMRHEVSEGGMLHKTTFVLERVDEAKYWLLGVVGYGELGTNTRLGF